MREEAFAKFARPLESQFVYERRRPRGLLATAGAIAVAIGATVILALVLFNAFPRSKSDPSELAVSISTPASATPAPATSEDSQALLEGFKQFQKTQGSEVPAVSEPAPLERPKKRPKNPRLCLISSCSGSNGNSVRNGTSGPDMAPCPQVPAVTSRLCSTTTAARCARSGKPANRALWDSVTAG
jgi:hypothetical protein